MIVLNAKIVNGDTRLYSVDIANTIKRKKIIFNENHLTNILAQLQAGFKMKQKNNLVNRALQINNKINRRDCVYTPEELAVNLIKRLDIQKSDILLDPAAGRDVFFRNFPAGNTSYKCEIEKGSNYFDFHKKVDWIITNPPYSLLNRYLEHSLKLARKGIAFLVGSYSITPLRLNKIDDSGFWISNLHYLKVSKWYAMQCFMVIRKRFIPQHEFCNVTYTRKVYQVSNHIKKSRSQQTL